MNNFIIGLGIAVLGTILNLILKRFVTRDALFKMGSAIKKTFNGIGIAITLGASKISILKDLWNSIIEPYVIILLRCFVMNALDGLIQGLETDKPSLKTKPKPNQRR